jgi:hypothetical protein
MFLSGGTQDPVGFDRLAWYQRGSLHAALAGSAFAIMGSFILAAGAGGLVRRSRRRPRREVSPRERHAWKIAVWSSGLMLAAPITGLALMMVGQSESGAADGLRRALLAALSLLLVGGLLALATVPATVLAWRRRYWTMGRRCHYTLFACAATVLLPLLLYYHLLGFWL